MPRMNRLDGVNSDYTPDGVLKPGAPSMQLFDLSKDPAESTNVINDHPDIVKSLETALVSQTGCLETPAAPVRTRKKDVAFDLTQ